MKVELYGAGKVLKGRLRVPGDKSISHRAIMFSALAEGSTVIEGFLPSADCLSTMAVFQSLGVSIEREGERLRVFGKGLRGLQEAKEALDCGNSGTTMRLMTGILSGQPFPSVLTGDESLCRRPMERVRKPLLEMGAEIHTEGERQTAPLHIYPAKLHACSYESPIASAQVKSAVLLAALSTEGETVYTEPFLSRDHTERMLSVMGADIRTTIEAGGKARIRIKGGATLRPFSDVFTVPGDISSASYFMAAVFFLPGSELLLQNVGLNPSRTGILEVLSRMGAEYEIRNRRVTGGEETGDLFLRFGNLHGTEISGAIIPRLIDELPILAILGVIAEGETVIKDAAELKVKESNRIRAVVENLQSLGISALETEDGMRIRGKGGIFSLTGKKVSSYKDHRIAMSFSILGLLCDKTDPMVIEDAECVSISYPQFFEDLEKLLDGNTVL